MSRLERKTGRRRVVPAQPRVVPLAGAVFLLLLCWAFSRLMRFSVQREDPQAVRSAASHPSTIPSTEKTLGHKESTQGPSSKVLFHEARTDRSGATIHDMLLAHAYAFRRNQTYGGACSEEPPIRLEDHRRMIAALGLGHVLTFNCPDETDRASGAVLDRSLYARFGTRIWTPEWLRHIRSQQRGGVAPARGARRVAVAHIRRGDVDLCDPTTSDRYLTNQHYRNLLETYARDADEVTIFSERKSSESWDDFAAYSLQLDGPPTEAWNAMMNADVLILSKSSFSIVPALFNRRGVVVYTPFWVRPLAHWRVIDDDTDRASRRAQIRLRSQLCELQ